MSSNCEKVFYTQCKLERGGVLKECWHVSITIAAMQTQGTKSKLVYGWGRLEGDWFHTSSENKSEREEIFCSFMIL